MPHSWIVECLEMFGIAENVKKFLIDSMKTRKTELTSSGERLGVIHIRRGIFQGDSLQKIRAPFLESPGKFSGPKSQL